MTNKAPFCAFLDFKLKELSQAPQIPPVSIATLKAIILFLTEPEQFLRPPPLLFATFSTIVLFVILIYFFPF